MGAGIAQVAIESGIETTLRDVEDKFVQKGMSTIKTFIGKKVEKGKITKEEEAKILDRLKGSTNPKEAAAGAEMVIFAPKRLFWLLILQP